MNNRAKCKLCQCIIESYRIGDYVSCSCGEVYVEDGELLKCGANNWENFMRVDDEGNEILVKVTAKNADMKTFEEDLTIHNSNVVSRKEKIEMLDEMIKRIEELPNNAMLTPITHYDFVSALLLLSSILRDDS